MPYIAAIHFTPFAIAVEYSRLWMAFKIISVQAENSMAEWLEHTVHVEVDRPIEAVWALWSDIAQMPNWMKWISSVEVLAEDPALSRWKLETTGLSFSWLSRLVKVVPEQVIQWESVDGLPNRGAIRFYGHKNGKSTVKMNIAYALPSILARLMMSSSFVDRVVTSTLQADLDRFREYALTHTDQSVTVEG